MKKLNKLEEAKLLLRVTEYVKTLKKVLKGNYNIRITGSLAMMIQSDISRELHDIDIAVLGNETILKAFINEMKDILSISGHTLVRNGSYTEESYTLPAKFGDCHINLLLQDTEKYPFTERNGFNGVSLAPIEDIIVAKQRYRTEWLAKYKTVENMPSSVRQSYEKHTNDIHNLLPYIL